MTQNRWNPGKYSKDFAFVANLAQDLVQWLDPRPGERVLDVGCGHGVFFDAIASSGATVVGVDASPEMVASSRERHPAYEAFVASATDLAGFAGFDAVFSNATLHWVPEPRKAARSIRRALRPGGRLVAEFGGAGNTRTVLAAVNAALAARGISAPEDNGWYFPDIADYSCVLRDADLRVTRATHFDRPTRLAGGRSGLRDWLQMFGTRWNDELSPEDYASMLREVETACEGALFDGTDWVVDYVRIRVHAVAV